MIRSSSSTDRALELLAAHDRALVAIVDASQASAVALARQSVAAEISAGLRERARRVQQVDWTDMIGSCVAALVSAADDIDAGRI